MTYLDSVGKKKKCNRSTDRNVVNAFEATCVGSFSH